MSRERGRAAWVSPLFAYTPCPFRVSTGDRKSRVKLLGENLHRLVPSPQLRDPGLLMPPPPARHTYLLPPSFLLPSISPPSSGVGGGGGERD